MHFTFASLETLEKAYAASPVRYREELHRSDEQKLKDFLEGVENAMSIIRNIPNVSVRQLDGTEMVELMGEYTNLFGGKRETKGYAVFFHHEYRGRKGQVLQHLR